MNAVLNHLWQSTAFALLAPVVAFWLRSNRAHVRYRVWLAASIKFLIPFSILIDAGSRLRLPSQYVAPAIVATAQSLGEPFTRTTGVIQSTAGAPHSIAPLVLGIWIFGLVVVLAVWCRRWLRAIGTVRSAELFENEALTALKTRLEIGVPVRLMASDTNLEPGVFGVFRPVVIIPTKLRDKLAAGQMESVIAHELCHIRRFDNLAALIHMLIEALFWFHPLVWWIGARLLEERERACDEAVLDFGAEPEAYAESILKICEHYLKSSLACVSGVTGSDLTKRMERIMNHRTGSVLSLSKKWLLAVLGVAAIAGPLVFGLITASPLRAQTEAYEANTTAPVFTKISITPNRSGVHWQTITGWPNEFRATNETLALLIQAAYKVDADQISSAPDWVNHERYDILAKVADSRGARFFSHNGLDGNVLQALLSDRFKLAVHRETRLVPVYVLVIAPNGPKLSESIPATEESGPRVIEAEKGRVGGREVPIPTLARILSDQLHQPVLDETGLHDHYDLTLQWQGDADSSAAAVSKALEEQLGLKLTQQQMSKEFLVIDHVEAPSAP